MQDPVYKHRRRRGAHLPAPGLRRQRRARPGAREPRRAMFRVSEPDGTPNPLVDFGFNIKDAEGNPVGEIAWSDVFNVIRDTPGVRKIGDARLDLKLNGLPADVRLNVREFPVLGTVTLVNGDTGGAALMAILNPSFEDAGRAARRGRALDAHGASTSPSASRASAPRPRRHGRTSSAGSSCSLASTTRLVVLAFFDTRAQGLRGLRERLGQRRLPLPSCRPRSSSPRLRRRRRRGHARRAGATSPTRATGRDVTAATGVFDGEPREDFEDQWRSEPELRLDLGRRHLEHGAVRRRARRPSRTSRTAGRPRRRI